MTTSAGARRRPLPAVAAGTAAVVVAAAASIALDAIIAVTAHHLGAPRGFKPLQISNFAALTIIGVLAGAVGWAFIRRRARNPRGLLARLVPAVIVVSLIPDLAVGFSKTFAHTTWGGVGALMIMHLAVAACAVTAYLLFMPLPRTTRR